MQPSSIDNVRNKGIPQYLPPLMNDDIADDEAVLIDSLSLHFIVIGINVNDCNLISGSYFFFFVVF
jgi:hypothetical protein